MAQERILIAGVGNIFLGDDAFGSEVARIMMQRELPKEVKVVDFGIRGFDLTYALLEDHDLTIIVDATPRGEMPGTLYTIEPDLTQLDELSREESMVETHGMNPLRVLRTAKAMGASFQKILIVGCEPSPLDPESEGEMGLSEPVRAAVASAVQMIESLVADAIANSEVTL